MTTSALGELRRVAAARRPEPLRGRTTTFAGDALAGDWSHELPGSSVEVILELEGNWELEMDGWHGQVGAFAAGMVAGAVRTRSAGAARLVQLAVDPLAIPALFGVPAGELSGIAVEIDALMGAGSARLLEQIDAADATGDAVAVAEGWVAARVAGSDGPGHALHVPADVRHAVALIHASDGRLRIDAIAQELGCTRRHLARRFKQWIGSTPSEYRRLVRFEGATDALRADPGQPLGRLAHACGYADHAHMDRDFAALAGASPSAVAARLR